LFTTFMAEVRTHGAEQRLDGAHVVRLTADHHQ
jgi:hypothetical protein